jgi:hypothetical protein
MTELTAAQRRAVRWYIGDVSGSDPFWGDPKAYVTLNALFFPGIRTERARAAEGKLLNPALLEDEERLMNAVQDLLSAFRPLENAVTACRVERYADFREMQLDGSCISFTSTSTAGFLDAYRDRTGIALMRFDLPAGTPCIPMAQALPDYAKADEAEILLPPALPLHIAEIPITPEQLSITDANGDPPVISVKAVPAGLPQRDPLPPPDDAGRLAGIRVLTALMNGDEPDDSDAVDYTAWKILRF